MTPAQTQPLAGFTVGVTAARRAEELGGLLERKGAAVCYAPTMRTVVLADDTELRRVTRRLVDAAPDVAVVTTGVGFRGWLEAAGGWELHAGLVEALGRARILARGPKSRGAIKAAGLTEAWSPASESSDEVLEHLLGAGVGGLRIAVQLHGEPLPEFIDALRRGGAEVVAVPVYRWEPPQDLAPVDRLIEDTLDGRVDAISFTSAPAAAGLLRRADQIAAADALLQRLRSDVLAACVGPVTAGPLVARDVPTVQPERSRVGPLVRLIAAELSRCGDQ
ncbi:MAG: uroporphyrinogen-III synthase [Pseudonocardiaceae bacterium]|nr:uroporphyrinogen-III synthase [Pseudonocardiaceae bacterium]